MNWEGIIVSSCATYLSSYFFQYGKTLWRKLVLIIRNSKSSFFPVSFEHCWHGFHINVLQVNKTNVILDAVEISLRFATQTLKNRNLTLSNK
jgi:hypothetical protein